MKIGIDTVNFSRIKDIDSFSKKILSNEETQKFRQLDNDRRKLEYVAGRFSVKESFVKASGLTKVNFKEISILNDELGKPFLVYGNYKCEISISHETDHVVTICVIE